MLVQEALAAQFSAQHRHDLRARPTRATRSRSRSSRRSCRGEGLTCSRRSPAVRSGSSTSWACRSSSTSATSDRRRRGSTRVFDWFRWVDDDLQHLQGRTARSAGSTAASSRSATPIPRSRAVLGALRGASRRDATATSTSAPPRLDAIDPSGLVKGWSVDRAAAILDAAGVRELRGQRRRRHAPARPRPPRAVLARRHPASAAARPGRRRRRGDGSRRRDLGRLRPRRARRRPAHGPAARRASSR